ncbi:YslB family protein [Halalkalibacterium ligniniphilum]|uniref:YslB family protein n=1 Tax=Halalkalibacterium ligniniphilum TaxID=1134413 RepID=UPI000346E261|nr:YslB family protein [Halalkalibacterium ligniniphilum]
METKDKTETYVKNDNFGYNLIRNDLLQDLLGSEHESILYWAGKSLARKHSLTSVEEVIDFFSKANWGELVLLKEKKQERLFELKGPWMGKDDERSYQLEAGFLAQQIQSWSNTIAEATYVQKKDCVRFTVRTDKYDTI